MPKQDVNKIAGLAARLAALRRAAGFTQIELAEAPEVTQRMISYYEDQTDPPPPALLPKLAQIFGVSVDELLSVKPIKPSHKPDSRTRQRLSQVENLWPAAKRQVIQLIDAFIMREMLNQQFSG
ncbi:helix-turn-helix domain-containing protein [Wenzhouxiangella sp. EGI_FJ10409]|uniref:helix-turn-helix domain-containing protein n=1 Tax=Wenzhouxiangella sp. EGI_FJ10409 TaxID=3243767 RepID=UPI0035D64238